MKLYGIAGGLSKGLWIIRATDTDEAVQMTGDPGKREDFEVIELGPNTPFPLSSGPIDNSSKEMY